MAALRVIKFPLRMLRAKNRDGSRLPADLWLLDWNKQPRSIPVRGHRSSRSSYGYFRLGHSFLTAVISYVIMEYYQKNTSLRIEKVQAD